MFICDITKKCTKCGEPMQKVIAITREKTYSRKIQNEETRVWEDKVIGRGFEPVKELSLSLEGLTIWESWSEAERQVFLERMNQR